MTKNNAKKKKLIVAVIAAVLVLFVAGVLIFSFEDTKVSKEISIKEAQARVEKQLQALPKPVASGAVAVMEKSTIFRLSGNCNHNPSRKAFILSMSLFRIRSSLTPIRSSSAIA